MKIVMRLVTWEPWLTVRFMMLKYTALTCTTGQVMAAGVQICNCFTVTLLM